MSDKYYKKIPVHPIQAFFIIVPVIFWTLAVYKIWYTKKYKWDLGKIILLPILMPYFYAIGTWLLFRKEKVPMTPEWKLCFTHPVDKKLREKGVVASWDWHCGELQTALSMGQFSDIQMYTYYVAYAILLIGILSTAFKKMAIFNDDLIRNFTMLSLTLCVLGGAFQWLNDYGVYSEFLLTSLSINLMGALAAFCVIIIGLIKGIGRY